VGKLTRHPTTKFEGESQQVTTFTLAVQEPSWEGKLYTLYVGCTSWGRAAETCSLLNAEDLIAVQGKLAWQQRTGKCGQEHSLLVVNVRDVAVLDAAAVEVSA
jgi:single-stranded DNA-binding protein